MALTLEEMIEEVRSKEPQLMEMRDNALRALGEVEGKIEMHHNLLNWLTTILEEADKEHALRNNELKEVWEADVRRRRAQDAAPVADEPTATTIYPEAAQSPLEGHNGSYGSDAMDYDYTFARASSVSGSDSLQSRDTAR